MKYLLIFAVCLFAFLDLNALLTPEDKANLAFFDALYAKNSTLECKSLSSKKLHFIWLGPKELPETSIKKMKAWVALHPNWEVWLWTDRERAVPFAQRMVDDFSFSFLEACYYASENFGERSEMLRYEILWQEGGLYVDHDTLPMRSFDALQESYDFYCGLEEMGPSVLSSSVFPSTHVIGCRSHHPILEKSMQWLAAHFQEMETFYPGTESSAIYNRVKHRSFSALHEGIKEAIDREGNRDIVFPPHYFSPKEKGLFAEHDHASTWFRPGKEFEEKLKKRMEDVEKKTARARVFLFSLCGFDLAVLLLFFLRRWNLWLLLLPCLLVGCDKKKETVSEFEQLMGKTSEHWKHVTQQEDKEALDSYQALYEKNKHYLSALAPHQKIPKIIHFIWLGPKPFPPESVENVRSWIAYHPDWKVKFWTDRERPVPCSSMERVLVDTFSFQFLEKCFHESQNYGEKSDILRFEILYKEGGVYADHDANCLIPFANLHAGFDFYCGLETPHPSFVGLNITSGNGLLGARPHHPVIKKVIELIAERWDFLGTKYRGRDAFSKSELVMQRTYIALTHALKECVDKESNIDIILPSAHFFAKNGLTPLYSKHFFATAWAETSEKKSSLDREMERTFEKLQKRATQMQMAALLVIALNALLFGYKKK